MRAALAMCIGLAACGRLDFEVGEHLDDWPVHQRLGLRNGARAEALVDFPVMVALDSTRFDYSAAAPDGHDLRFTDATGTRLAYEIESWQPGGRSIVWVRVPRIETASDAGFLTMYSGLPSAPPPVVEASETWSSSYVGVFHMAGALADSTAAGLAGSTFDVGYGAGPVGDAMLVSSAGPPSFSRIPAGPLVDEIATFSGLLRVDSAVGNYSAMMTLPIVALSLDRVYLGQRNGWQFAELVSTVGTYFPIDGPSGTFGTWAHLAIVLDHGTSRFYVDGVLASTVVYDGGDLEPRALGIFLGADCDSCPIDVATANSDFLDGAIDELRFESAIRSDAWMDAQAAALRDELVSY